MLEVGRKALIGLAVLGLFLASCSTDATPDDQESTTTETTRPTRTTRVREDPTSTTASVTSTTQQQLPSSSSSTSTAPTSITSPPTSSTSDGVVGVVGCSNTDQAVVGYTSLSSKDRLTPGDLGGGTAAIWGNPTHARYPLYWALYDERRPSSGYPETWVQLCLRSSEHGGVFDVVEQDLVTHIVEQIVKRDPGITIWISPINFYGGGQVCTATGPDGPAIAGQAADWGAATFGNVFRGPDLGPLLPEHIGVRDDCHPNEAGEALMGAQLVEFFD